MVYSMTDSHVTASHLKWEGFVGQATGTGIPHRVVPL